MARPPLHLSVNNLFLRNCPIARLRRHQANCPRKERAVLAGIQPLTRLRKDRFREVWYSWLVGR